MDVQVSQELRDRVLQAAADQGFDSASAWIRHAIQDRLTMTTGLSGLEDRMAGAWDAMRRDLQVLYAGLDGFVKLYLALATTPETLRARYDGYVTNVATMLSGKRSPKWVGTGPANETERDEIDDDSESSE